ncbi:hypothetical protein SKAU_G00224410 [Synaphobranchus kaupii]|uniref:Uncharacterized protein n=1 Tax=Synaphobranchus kaupii TaxID=118154 RepID=A0A9Q1IVT9_SYNKA|nr:hypothetical protein SKAU_G00224410 [Synaphobranchus kaupii]
MRPSSSLIYEPGAERGIPRGRDLFTFVTSAASHMMRTLQRPRKSRPSKRQVNHRRFLHNMIQGKFAEIEAANRQLSTAIFSREGEGTQASSPICVSTDQSDDTRGEESSTDMLPPTLPSVSTSLSLSQSSPDNTTPANQEESSSLWTFNLHLENTQEHLDPPFCHTFSTEMYDIDTEANQHTLQWGGWGIAEEEGCTTWRSFDPYKQSLDAQPGTNLQREPVKFDDVMKLTDNILDENINSFVENVKKCEVIRNSPESDSKQQYNAASLTPDIHTQNLNPMPTPTLESQSLSSCAFGSQTATNSHCSLTDMNNILENPQADTTDSFYLIDSDTREGKGCRDTLHPAETVWAPPSEDTVFEIPFDGTFLNTAFDMSNCSADDLICCLKASGKRNAGVRSSNDTNRSDLDYLPASFSQFDSLDRLRMNDGRESGDADGDLGIWDSWASDPTSISQTKTPVNSGVEGNDTFCKNYRTGYDTSSITGPVFLSSVYGSQGNSQSTLGGGEGQEIGSEVQGIVPSACLDPPLGLNTGLDQSSTSSGYHPVPPNPTSFPNSCSYDKTPSSCMRGGDYQNHTPFMDVAKFESQKPHAYQILTPPLDDYWLFDNILGEHETRGI